MRLAVAQIKSKLSHMYTQNPKNKQFAFRNQQIANSPYHLVKECPEQQVIRQTDFDNVYNKEIPCVDHALLDFERMQGRESAAKGKSAAAPHDQRFNLHHDFDKSTVLSKIRRVQGRDFVSYSDRDSAKLLRQGGDRLDVDILDDTRQFYDTTKKEAHSLERLDKQCLPFNKYAERTHARSIYHRDWQATQDPYDMQRVDLGKLKTTKGSEKKAQYSLSKQPGRDYRKLYQGSVGDAYDNIRRENERADYIKKLLMSA